MVDVENDIDWHETHILLKTAFPVSATSPFATYEIPFGTIERPTTRDNSWEKAQFEVPAQYWADLGNGKHGLSVINESKFGYDAVGNLLRLTLLRSPTWPDPEADRGHHHFHYALYPHDGTWKDALTVRHGFEYNYPLTAVVTTAHAGTLPTEHSFASVAPENVVLTAVKKAEDAKGLIFRAYEWAGKDSTAEFHVPPGATGATVTNMMETPEGSPLEVAGDIVKAPIHPYEILTIRVDYPNGGPKGEFAEDWPPGQRRPFGRRWLHEERAEGGTLQGRARPAFVDHRSGVIICHNSLWIMQNLAGVGGTPGFTSSRATVLRDERLFQFCRNGA